MIRRSATLAAVLLALGVSSGCGADEIVPKPFSEFSPKGPYEPKDTELEVWQLYQDGRLITARRKVDELLETEPYSIYGHYVLGQVLRESEGQLPKSMKHLGRARELFETRYPTFPLPEGEMKELHRELLFAGQGVAGELEKFDYQLSMLDFYDSLYSPELVAEHAWPLMKLGRTEEARKVAKEAIESDTPGSRSLGRNAMCAIEGEAATRQPRFEACLAAFDDASERAANDEPGAPPDERTPLAVHAYNAAQAAHGVLRPDEVERLAIAGTSRLDFTPANPWRVLTRLYISQARFSDGIYALQEMLRWRRRQPPYLREQDRAQTDVAQATFLLAIGRTEPGLVLVDRALARPDRRGLTSGTKEQATGAHALLRLALRRADAEHQAERDSWGEAEEDAAALNKPEEDPVAVGPVRRSAANLADRERIRTILTDEARMMASFRPYVSGGLEPVPTWLVGDLIDAVGPGIARVMVEQARDAESESESKELLAPYYDALEAEIALAEGEEDESLRLVEKALSTLPETEVLLKARVAAVGAEAADGKGDNSRAQDYLAQVMTLDPGTVRRRGLALPVTIRNSSGGAIGPVVAERLEDSPRLSDGGGFTLSVAGADRALRLCLSGPDGAELSCTEVDYTDAKVTRKADDGEGDSEEVAMTDEQAILATLQAFHDRAFGFGLELSSIDLRSLDGQTVVAEEATRDKMQSVIDQVSQVD